MKDLSGVRKSGHQHSGQWMDSHCHLHYESDLERPTQSAELLLIEARASGVCGFVTVGVERSTFPLLQSYSEKFSDVVFTVGFHPHEANQMQSSDFDLLRTFSKHPRCRAIGEIGLDYYYEHSPREVQITRLEEQLELAKEVKLPVVIHSRDAEEDLLPALERYAKSTSANTPGVIHCFTGTKAFGKACIDLGFYISFSGILTFKNAEDLRECATYFPLERLMVETDSPYLAPIPFRGRPCEPKMVVHTGTKLAELRGLSIEMVANQTTQNTKTVFQLESLGF